ncbi:MAG: hypothetical protein RMJ56_02850 [Gemmataceae bacterium]|nr:hypothetical protein [Gemmata sp.]MDW8196526.1 hypothetical protein [Gemmataceae bacterium]
MLCPRCYGKHIIALNGLRIPCPECAGLGDIHCCDGLREQTLCPSSEITPPFPAAPTWKADDTRMGT